MAGGIENTKNPELDDKNRANEAMKKELGFGEKETASFLESRSNERVSKINDDTKKQAYQTTMQKARSDFQKETEAIYANANLSNAERKLAIEDAFKEYQDTEDRAYTQAMAGELGDKESKGQQKNTQDATAQTKKTNDFFTEMRDHLKKQGEAQMQRQQQQAENFKELAEHHKKAAEWEQNKATEQLDAFMGELYRR